MVKKLFNALSRSRSNFLKIFNILSKDISEDEIDTIEELLIETDIGYDAVESIIEIISNDRKDEIDLVNAIKSSLLQMLPDNPQLSLSDNKNVLLIVGVNGSGKTTTSAKLASYYKNLGHDVTLVAADTYRAAAVEQIKIWSERVGCRLICNEETSEPASVVFNGLQSATANESDIVIVDTAGRLHTSTNLMKELEKINRVIIKRFPEYEKKSLITIDASLGQNSLVQAKEFDQYTDVNGAIITKLDGTAKGGVVFPLYNKYNIPVHFIGIGEKLNDFAVFDSATFINNMLDINENG